MPGVHQQHGETAGLQQFIQGYPVHAGRTHNIMPINIVRRLLLFSIRFILFVVSE
jgi:hypothetical protein